MENEREIPRLIKISTADESLIKQKEVRKKYLVNKLNYINFHDAGSSRNFYNNEPWPYGPEYDLCPDR